MAGSAVPSQWRSRVICLPQTHHRRSPTLTASDRALTLSTIGRMSFTVEPDALRRAAKQVWLAAEGVASVDLAGSADLLAAALPGGKSERTTHRLADDWSSTIATWSREVREHGDKLDDCALSYMRFEQHVTDEITAAGRPR